MKIPIKQLKKFTYVCHIINKHINYLDCYNTVDDKVLCM